MRFEIERLGRVLLAMMNAFPETLNLSVLILVFSMAIAVVFALCEYFHVRGIQTLIKVYTSFFRGTPLVAQLFFFYFGLPAIIPQFTAVTGFTSAMITMSLNNSAYMKEAIRGALLSVEKGQIEAGLSVGYTNKQVVRYIILPQATRIAIPALANSFVDIIKGTSMAFTVGVIEITAAARMEAASSLHFFESYCALILFYWVVVLILETTLRVLEKRLNQRFE